MVLAKMNVQNTEKKTDTGSGEEFWKGQRISERMMAESKWVKAICGDENAELGVCEVNGSCMEPLIHHQSWVAFTSKYSNRKLLKGGIYLFREGTELFIKHLQIINNTLVISAAEKSHRGRTIGILDIPRGFEIVGEVVWTGTAGEFGKTTPSLDWIPATCPTQALVSSNVRLWA